MAPFFIAALYLLFVPAIFLANSDIAHAADQFAQANTDVERTIESGREDLDLVRDAISSNPDLGILKRKVTFAEVLADPDNIEINILYARTQILEGRLDRAQAALERVLLQRPDLHYVRMLYAVVVYRLGNFVEAEGVFNALLSSDISAENKLQANKYLYDIEAKKKRTKFTLSTTMGIHYDSNKNSAPKSGDLLLLDTLISNGAKEESDTGMTVSASLEVRHDLGLQRAHELYGKITLTTDQQATQDDLDLIVGRIDLGGVIASDAGTFDLSINHNRINLSQNFYLMENGAKIRWDALGGNKFRPYFEQKIQNQLYRTSHNSSASEKNGLNMETKAGTKITFSPVSLLDIHAVVGKKKAIKKYNAYDKLGAGVAYTRLFEKGRFLIGQGIYRIDSYKENDAFVSSITRRDAKATLRIMGGMPLLSVFGSGNIPEALNDVQLIGTLETSRTGSNIVNFETVNHRAQLMLSKTIRF